MAVYVWDNRYLVRSPLLGFCTKVIMCVIVRLTRMRLTLCHKLAHKQCYIYLLTLKDE